MKTPTKAITRVLTLSVLLAFAGVLPAAAQGDPDFSTSTKEGVDRNGPPADLGDFVDWTLVVTNSSTFVAQMVTVTDTISADQAFSAAGQGGTYDPATTTVTWSFATTPELRVVLPGTSVTLTLTTEIVSVAPTPGYCNQGEILAYPTSRWVTDDPATPTPGDPTCLGTARASVRATKAVADDGADGGFDPGEKVTYTIEVANTGTLDLVNVRVTDDLPPELENYRVISIPPGAADTSDLSVPRLSVEGFTLSTAGSASVVVEASIPSGAATGGTICNLAVVETSLTAPVSTSPPSGPPGSPTCFDVRPVPAPPPAVIDIDPCRGTKSGGTDVTVTGQGFQPGARLFLGGAEAAVVSVTPIEIRAVTGRHPSVGSADVMVRNPDAQEGVLAGGWSYTPPPFPIRLKGGKKSGSVWLVWTDTGQGENVVVRSTDPLHGCDSTLIFVTETEHLDPDLDDGRTYYYSVE